MKNQLIVACSALAMLLPAGAEAQSEPVMESLRPQYERAKAYLLQIADESSDAEYAYRPAEDVRTTGQMLAHIAETQFFYCSAGLGEAEPLRRDVEGEATSKAEILAALQESFAYCDEAYAQSDAEAMQTMQAFRADRPRLSILVSNAGHNWEHYGNLVTYLRLQGTVPPSSRPRD